MRRFKKRFGRRNRKITRRKNAKSFSKHQKTHKLNYPSISRGGFQF